jgi:hypothetical protein
MADKTCFLREMDAVQTFFKAAANLNSWRLNDQAVTLARPVVIIETISRGRDRYISRYIYVNRVKVYAKLCINSVDELIDLQDALQQGIEGAENVLKVYDDTVPAQGQEKQPIGLLKQVEIKFPENGSDVGLDVNFTIEYEATYSRNKPAAPSPVNHVTAKIKVEGGIEIVEND